MSYVGSLDCLAADEILTSLSELNDRLSGIATHWVLEHFYFSVFPDSDARRGRT